MNSNHKNLMNGENVGTYPAISDCKKHASEFIESAQKIFMDPYMPGMSDTL